MEAPKLLKPIPAQVVNERAAFGPVNLRQFFKFNSDDEDVYFSAMLKDGKSLPAGMMVLDDGELAGIPARGTTGHYDVVLSVENDAGKAEAEFTITIKEALLTKDDGADYFDKLKNQVWAALGDNLPVPDLKDLLERAVTPLDIHYLLQRWGTLTIYDAYNLDPPTNKIELTLADASPHYYIYDRGSCLVSCPKDLFSYDRTLADGLQSARVMAREAYKRGWTMELVGYEQYSRAAWVELQVLGEQNNKPAEVINYRPSTQDVEIVTTTLVNRMTSGME